MGRLGLHAVDGRGRWRPGALHCNVLPVRRGTAPATWPPPGKQWFAHLKTKISILVFKAISHQRTTTSKADTYHAHVGSGPRKRLCACGIQVEPAAWPGPASGGGLRLRQGWLSLPGHACCTPHNVIICFAAGERHAYVRQVCSCRPELRRCHCRHCCCQHCRPPSVGVWEAIAE